MDKILSQYVDHNINNLTLSIKDKEIQKAYDEFYLKQAYFVHVCLHALLNDSLPWQFEPAGKTTLIFIGVIMFPFTQVSPNFILKAVQNLTLCILYYSLIAVNRNNYQQIVMFWTASVFYTCHQYGQERERIQNFIEKFTQKQNLIRQKVIMQLIPGSFMVSKYDDSKSQQILLQSNNKCVEQLKVANTDTFIKYLDKINMVEDEDFAKLDLANGKLGNLKKLYSKDIYAMVQLGDLHHDIKRSDGTDESLLKCINNNSLNRIQKIQKQTEVLNQPQNQLKGKKQNQFSQKQYLQQQKQKSKKNENNSNADIFLNSNQNYSVGDYSCSNRRLYQQQQQLQQQQLQQEDVLDNTNNTMLENQQLIKNQSRENQYQEKIDEEEIDVGEELIQEILWDVESQLINQSQIKFSQNMLGQLFNFLLEYTQNYQKKFLPSDLANLSEDKQSFMQMMKVLDRSNSSLYNKISVINISEDFQFILKLFKEQIVELDVELELQLPEKLKIQSNRKYVLVLFYNLIDNCLKYGGKKMKVQINKRENQIIQLSISNTVSQIQYEKLQEFKGKIRSGIRLEQLGLHICEEIVREIGPDENQAFQIFGNENWFQVNILLNKKIRNIKENYEESLEENYFNLNGAEKDTTKNYSINNINLYNQQQEKNQNQKSLNSQKNSQGQSGNNRLDDKVEINIQEEN
ncbi:Histidine kinase-like ATPase, ATP-binding domain [Pseudocohnilembus persalinus]|uniref:Histidine kinase-like ATPase, ATP-binding domain n=1 Tax=Pseudocohnilembus persalinus TaxID=266149 RepID=A0A0V0QXH3_PSEPJ|nr:Histidine kinase-like ATPase, ATP-binding domain [Pseudocohnilembus persalinus]|eukprot:KRX07081.1 Histidine kinase-like ATPase, ATP-binding domain [Pseudocohnilembus persalinus]